MKLAVAETYWRDFVRLLKKQGGLCLRGILSIFSMRGEGILTRGDFVQHPPVQVYPTTK